MMIVMIMMTMMTMIKPVRPLLEQWAGQIVIALARAGIHETEHLGRSFDPEWAESIGTAAPVPREAIAVSGDGQDRSYVPYEVVEVVRRGFVGNDGRLLRKARVITVREVDPLEEGRESLAGDQAGVSSLGTTSPWRPALGLSSPQRLAADQANAWVTTIKESDQDGQEQ